MHPGPFPQPACLKKEGKELFPLESFVWKLVQSGISEGEEVGKKLRGKMEAGGLSGGSQEGPCSSTTWSKDGGKGLHRGAVRGWGVMEGRNGEN